MALPNREEARRIIAEVEARTGNNRALEEVLVEEITADENHPLRDVLEWNEDEAVRQYHLVQMRKYINTIREVYRDPIRNRDVVVPSFIRNPTEPPGTYIPMVRLRAEPDVAVEVSRVEFDRAERALLRALKVTSVLPRMEVQNMAAIERLEALLRRFRVASAPE